MIPAPESGPPHAASHVAPESRGSSGAPFAVRISKPLDMPLVMSDWTRGCYQHTSDGRRSREGMYKDWLRGIIGKLLDRPGTVVMVACDKADDNRLFGWLCCSLDYVSKGLHVAHYGHVKSLYRGAGVFRALCDSVSLDEESRVAFTFSTRRTRKLAARCSTSEFLPVEKFLSEG